MSTFRTLSGSLALALALAASPGAAPAQTASAAQSSAHDRLFALFAAAEEAALKLSPLEALSRGDMRYADQFGDYISDAYANERRGVAQGNLDALKAIDRATLSPADQIAYDVFQTRQQRALRALAPEVLKTARLLPIDHMTGLQSSYASYVSGNGIAPFNTLADYESNLKRVDGFVTYLDRSVALMKEGVAAKVTLPRVVVEAMLKQLDNLLAPGVDGSVFMGPTKKYPAAIPATDQTRLTTAYRSAIGGKINPALTRLRDYLRNDYLPVARTSTGLSALPGGDKLYALAIEQNTTLPMTADEVHNLGLSEVKRIRAEMEAIRVKVGFKGDLPAFFAHLRTDPQFRFPTTQALGDHYRAIAAIVDKHVPAQFSTIPKAPLDIRPVPDFAAPVAPPAYYEQSTPDGTRPGVFYFNAYDLPTRTSWSMDAYFLHEGAPGHHFQISLAQEDKSLPDFMRFGGDTAYVEGWGLYAESLWQEMGVETDPYTRFGGLNAEIWRAIRLVVDSGIHAKGWTRDQAIQYFLDNSGVSRTDATSEVDRYIAMPGQALAYKVGQLTIIALKQEARAALGAKFDPRAFHAQVLNTGSLPMPVLQSKIRTWIASQK